VADSAAAHSVLVIDDEPLIRSFAMRALRAEGFAVAEAAGGREGLEIALADPPDVVLLDLGLPDLEGAEVLRRLRHERPDQAVLVWSASADAAAERRCLLLGARACLRKPTPIAELLQSVGSAGRPRPTANSASLPPGSRTCGRGGRRTGQAKGRP
jgi:two-component system, OmpR family, KDP operon response regulator KdpE